LQFEQPPLPSLAHSASEQRGRRPRKACMRGDAAAGQSRAPMKDHVDCASRSATKEERPAVEDEACVTWSSMRRVRRVPRATGAA
jgi:hypothetical protein